MPECHLGDVTIHYESQGRGQAALLVHGLGSSTRDWEFNIEALAAEHRVLACDCRGHGRSSSPPGRFTIEQFATDAAALLEKLGAAPAHLVGISMGGMIVLQLAAARPELVRSLVVVNAGFRLRFERLRERLSLRVRKLLMRLAGMKAVGRKLGREMFPEHGQEHLRRLVSERWAENDPSCYRRALQAVLEGDLRDRVDDITCPVLFVRGELDETPMEVSDEQLGRLPAARKVIVPGSRHATCVDRPEEFNRLVLDFWREVEKQPAGEAASV